VEPFIDITALSIELGKKFGPKNQKIKTKKPKNKTKNQKIKPKNQKNIKQKMLKIINRFLIKH